MSIRYSEEWKAKISETKKNQPCKIAGWNKGLTAKTNASMAKISMKLKQRALDGLTPKTREITWGDAISKGKQGKPCCIAGWNRGLTKETNTSVAKMANNAERNAKISNALKGREITWNDKLRKSMMKRLQNPEEVRRLFAACGYRPNKCENKLTAILDAHFPYEWQYVGDGQVILGGKCPDFINVNGHKWIIELNGEYWHRNDDPQKRISEFKKFGYETLIIWTKELKNETALVQKIKSFPSVETLHGLPCKG